MNSTSKFFFTADEHYGHANIIIYCNRPFTSVDEMDAEIIRRHNEMIGPKDVVIHAGDFTLSE
jgi:calcineurin-like phosphoesterase family protein